MWLVYAVLSNLVFSLNDLVAYSLSGAKTYNGLAVGTAMHLWLAALAPVAEFVYQIFSGKELGMVMGAWETFASSGFLLPAYALCLFLANGLLYQAYALGAREGDINPGIAASLSNVSLVISTALPVLVYGSKLTLYNALGIATYLVGAYFLVQPKKATGTKEAAKPTEDKDTDGMQWWTWLFYALGSGLLYGVGAFIGYMITRKQRTSVGSSLHQAYGLYFGQALIGVLLAIAMQVIPAINTGILKGYADDLRDIVTTPRPAFVSLVGGLSGMGGITALLRSYKTAPNPGFSDAISNLYTATTAVLSWVIYNTALGDEQMIGIAISAVSIGLLST